MEKRIFTMIVVAALAVTLGVTIVSKQAREPILREILKQQNNVAQAVARVESKLGEAPQGGADSIQVKALEGRIATLEMQVKAIQDLIKSAGGPGAQAQQQAGPPPEDYNKVHNIPVDHSYVLGNKNASVTIVEFSDLQCPFCNRFHGPLKEVLKAYPDQVKVVFKNFPLSFHQQARPAAKAAFAAGEQGKYFEMVDKLLANQKALSDADFEKYAKELGLDVAKFLKDYKEKDAKWEDQIKKDMELGQQVGVRGTPSFYLNGKKTRARDFATYKSEIDAILKK